MLEGNLENAEESQTSRKTLGKLPSTVKASRVSKDTAGVFQSVTNHLGARSSNQAVSKIKVYEEVSLTHRIVVRQLTCSNNVHI